MSNQIESVRQGLERVFPVGHEMADRIFYDPSEGQYYDAGSDLYLFDYDPTNR